MKIFIASFHRATDGALSKLISKMKDNDLWTDDYKDADYILAVADRKETMDFVLKRYRENKKIIHLFAGEKSCWTTGDDAYRNAITLMSDIQLCTNNKAKNRVKKLCKAVGKKYYVATIGNVMLDNLEIDESLVPRYEYDLVLYNPPSRLSKRQIYEELTTISDMITPTKMIWVQPNGDKGSEYIDGFWNKKTVPRPQFLGLMKYCRRFITNSSCQYYEAPFLLKPEQIIPIGKRNIERESKYADMSIKGASNKIIKLLKELG